MIDVHPMIGYSSNKGNHVVRLFFWDRVLAQGFDCKIHELYLHVAAIGVTYHPCYPLRREVWKQGHSYRVGIDSQPCLNYVHERVCWGAPSLTSESSSFRYDPDSLRRVLSNCAIRRII